MVESPDSYDDHPHETEAIIKQDGSQPLPQSEDFSVDFEGVLFTAMLPLNYQP